MRACVLCPASRLVLFYGVLYYYLLLAPRKRLSEEVRGQGRGVCGVVTRGLLPNKKGKDNT